MRRFSLCVFALCALSALSGRPLPATDNVLLIIADDLGVDSLHAYTGGTQDVAPTPNIDAMASSGVLLTNFWANPICSPTRAALLTGRHGFRTGVGSPEGNSAIPLTEYTLADVMNSRGYHTACIGKWHLHNRANGGASNPNIMGFDHYEGSLGGGVPNYYAWSETINGVTSSTDNTNYVTSETTTDAINWINSKGNDSWFCWVAYNAPHTPFHLPPTSLHSFDSLNPTGESDLAYYKAMVEALDTEIGRLLGSISPSVLAETTVIFIGDNGTPGQVSNDHERSAKGSLFQGGVHTPAIISGKAVAAPLNRTHEALVHVSDLFATIAELGGYDVDTDLPAGVFVDSRSIAPYLADANLPSIHDFAFAERFTADGANADGKTIRGDQYKYIRLDNGNERMFDVVNDPTENTNLINRAAFAGIANQLRGQMDTMLASPTPPRIENIEINDGNAQRSTLTKFSVQFDVNVAIDESLSDAFSFTNAGTAQSAGYHTDIQLVDRKTRVVFTFATGPSVDPRGVLQPSLSRGVYEFAANASQISVEGKSLDGNGDGTGGDDFSYGTGASDTLYTIFGDGDGNGNVDYSDFANYFLPLFGSSMGSAGYQEFMDFDGDTDIDYSDFSQGFLPNFGESP